jgi:lipopolysaccharide assembly protein B
MYIALSTIIFCIIIISGILFYISIKSFYKKKSNAIPVEYLQSMNYLLSDQHDKALDTFMSMVSVSKDTAETHIILGNMFRNRGEVDRAIKIHQNLIARPELNPRVRQECSLELAKDYLKSGFLDRAETILIKLANEIDRPIQVLKYLKEIYEQEKEWEKAIEISNNIQSISNEDLSITISHYYCELAELELTYLEDKSIDKAKKLIKKSLAYNNKSIRALILLGDISFLRKNYTDALKKYIGTYDNYPKESYLVIDKLKNTYAKMNKDNNFFDFLKSITDVKNPIDIFSNINKSSSVNMSNEEISNLYNNEILKNNINLSQLSEYIDLIEKNNIAFDNTSLNNIKICIEKYSKKESMHECIQCGFGSTKHFWQCPGCHQWSTIKKNIIKNSNSHYVI